MCVCPSHYSAHTFVFHGNLSQARPKNIILANCLACYSWLLPPLLELTAFHMCSTNPIQSDSPDKQSSNRLPGYPTESREYNGDMGTCVNYAGRQWTPETRRIVDLTLIQEIIITEPHMHIDYRYVYI